MTETIDIPVPSSVNVSRGDRIFQVLWDGGHSIRFILDDLRAMCECALCRAEEEKKEKQKREAKASRMLPVLGSASRAEITSVEHVGRYAIGVGWKDGHQSIYTYETLFEMCPCDSCSRRRELEADIKPEDS